MFSQSAEQHVLLGLIEEARARGAMRLVGEYQPTAKNDVVAGVYTKLGFVAGDGAYFIRDLNADIADLVTHIAAA